MSIRKIIFQISLAILVGGVADGVSAQTSVWTGAVGPEWTNSANWQNSLVPGDGDNVLIPASATQDPAIPAGEWPSESQRYGGFEVESGRVVTCLGDPSVTNEASGGGVDGDGKIHGIGVTIRCTGALIDGTLSANQQGFPAGQGPGAGRNASHGGGTAPYGNLQVPTALGSGSDTQSGGGAIAILATGTITVNGTITADGLGDYNRASAGGSIWLECGTLAGGSGGIIRALGGGYAGRIWAGAGGRISLDYQGSTYGGTITAVGGGNNNWQILTGGGLRGQAGTLWEPNRDFPREGGIVTIDGSYQYHFPEGSGVYAWDELVIDGAWVELRGDADVAIATLTATNNAVFRWSDNVVALGPGDLTLGGSRIAQLELPAGTNHFAAVKIKENGQLIALSDVTAVNSSSGGVPEDPHGAGITLYGETVDIAAGGQIFATRTGFGVRSGPGGDALGAGHGGLGTSGSTTYGHLSRPTALGSGGHVSDAFGGGAIAIFADAVSIASNGWIVADGGSSGNGCGAGGSIWIRAGMMTGGGSLLVRGGDDNDRYGGGGRIALETGPDSAFTGAITARGGIYNSATGGDTGSVFRASSEIAGVYGGPGASPVSLESDFTLNAGSAGIQVERSVTQWGRLAYEWSDTSKDFDDADLNNSADYRLSGFEAGKRAGFWLNGDFVDTVTVDSQGELSIAGVLLAPDAVVRVEFPAAGSLILIR